jgi:hypothetical protein
MLVLLIPYVVFLINTYRRWDNATHPRKGRLDIQYRVHTRPYVSFLHHIITNAQRPTVLTSRQPTIPSAPYRPLPPKIAPQIRLAPLRTWAAGGTLYRVANDRWRARGGDGRHDSEGTEKPSTSTKVKDSFISTLASVLLLGLHARVRRRLQMARPKGFRMCVPAFREMVRGMVGWWGDVNLLVSPLPSWSVFVIYVD